MHHLDAKSSSQKKNDLSKNKFVTCQNICCAQWSFQDLHQCYDPEISVDHNFCDRKQTYFSI